ncbi:MAG: HAMP domain-containing sensor histidine kinase, partial [Bacillota bacterium]
ISHELRTPLNILLSAIQVIEVQIKNENRTIDWNKIIKNINIEKQNCYRLIRLTNNLIDITKIDSGNLDFRMNNYNIVSIIENITLSVAEYIKHNNLSLVFDTEIEEKTVYCDQDIMERIIFNLLSNSIKFTESGGSIFVNIFDGEEFITITIEDTGIGIPKEKLDLIFERFRQVDKSFRRKNEGSGIGLSLVKSMVEIQGGKISVESKYGVGTKFTIKFPVKTLYCDNVEEAAKEPDNNTINYYVDTINVEFSDIYK